MRGSSDEHHSYGSTGPDRLWIGHTRAVHRIMDRLRADHPGLRIEACAGGGGPRVGGCGVVRLTLKSNIHSHGIPAGVSRARPWSCPQAGRTSRPIVSGRG
ncbi:hypothetical protein EAO76_33555 [Streptomyces sp. sk2.1]|nr:hypothetical protein EAO76_33555 [Streptomyces sp. sk2.1]